MLLVHDDQAQPSERREHRGARADDEVHVAAADPVPLIVTLAVGERAVLNRHAIAERAAEQRRHRRRQRDLRDQQQHLPASALDRLRQAQIDLGLAAAGDAVQQRGPEASRLDERSQLFEGRRAAPASASRAASGTRSGMAARSNGSRSSASARNVTRPRVASRASTSLVTPRSRNSPSGSPHAGRGEDIQRRALLGGQARSLAWGQAWPGRGPAEAWPRARPWAVTVATWRVLNDVARARAPGGIATAIASPMPAR